LLVSTSSCNELATTFPHPRCIAMSYLWTQYGYS
jgi:hypothetical protein